MKSWKVKAILILIVADVAIYLAFVKPVLDGDDAVSAQPVAKQVRQKNLPPPPSPPTQPKSPTAAPAMKDIEIPSETKAEAPTPAPETQVTMPVISKVTTEAKSEVPPPPQVKHKPAPKKVVNSSPPLKDSMYPIKKTCQMKQSPSSSAKTLGQLRKGKKVWVEGLDSNWGKVYFKKKPAYISKACL